MQMRETFFCPLPLISLDNPACPTWLQWLAFFLYFYFFFYLNSFFHRPESSLLFLQLFSNPDSIECPHASLRPIAQRLSGTGSCPACLKGSVWLIAKMKAWNWEICLLDFDEREATSIGESLEPFSWYLLNEVSSLSGLWVFLSICCWVCSDCWLVDFHLRISTPSCR